MIIIGHRGAKGQAVENTLASIKAGLDSGVQEIEIDVRLTRDGTIVLMHDADMRRMHDSPAIIADSTYDELIAIEPDMTTLEEAINIINKRVPLLVEVKPDVPTEPIVKLIEKYLARGWQAQHFLIGTKDQKTLLQLHAALPEIEKVVIEAWSGVRACLRAKAVDTKRLSMNQLWLWSGFIKPMARRGYKIAAYPLNNVERAKRWEKYGLHGVITDYPERFKKN
jgi:glycerophosphoryl diester phosphodiesterase